MKLAPMLACHLDGSAHWALLKRFGKDQPAAPRDDIVEVEPYDGIVRSWATGDVSFVKEIAEGRSVVDEQSAQVSLELDASSGPD